MLLLDMQMINQRSPISGERHGMQVHHTDKSMCCLVLETNCSHTAIPSLLVYRIQLMQRIQHNGKQSFQLDMS